jgi:arylformamidase
MIHLNGATPADIDKQYNARLSMPHADSTFVHWTEQSASTRSRFACVLDLPYGSSRLERLDYFPTQLSLNAAPKPLLIFIHGGYWRSRDKSEFSFMVQPYVRAGINVALLNYDLVPSVSLKTICLQVANAIAWLVRRHDSLIFAPDQITVAGHSAGGHLAAMAASIHWDDFALGHTKVVKHFASLSGLFDLAPLAKAPFIKADLQLSDADVDAISPALFPAPADCTGLVAVGELESQAFHEQSALLVQRWPKVVGPVFTAKGCDHLTICSAMGDEKSPLTRALIELIHS